jgi:oxygen-independent coproporphyrinogen III oxidase
MNSSSTKHSAREDFSFEDSGVYVHVPFCARRCRYCDFVVTTASGDAAHRRFLEALSLESAHRAPDWRGRTFESLYFGGGTPSRLSPSEFAALVAGLRRHFRFSAGAETTLEANPDDIESGCLAAWRAAGVTRVSLGAQSFREETLKFADRSHGAAQIGEAVRRLRKAGFANINLDLILSMPGETLEDVRHSVECVLELEPEHVSLYELVVEPRTVFGKWYGVGGFVGAYRNTPLQKLPDENEQIEMLTTARSMLKDAGYRHYELLNFAKPGFESRHNLLYWANRDYLGLGPGAYGCLGGRRWRLAGSVDEYYRKVSARDWTPAEEESLPAPQREVESFLLALRVEDGAPAARFADVIGQKAADIARLVDQGLLNHDERGVRLSERGKLFAETVFSELC